MSQALSRRAFLGVALAAASTLPAAVRAGSHAPKRLVAGTRVLDVNGRAARVFGLTGPDGRSGLRLRPDERFHVDLANQTGVRTLVHWHGQLPPWTQDGFPWLQTPPLANGIVQSYDYEPISGTYWMHSHLDMQEQNLMTAPLIVSDRATVAEDRQEIVLMLHDFTFRTPEEVLAGLTRVGATTAEMPRPAGSGMAMGAAQTGQHMDLNDVKFDAFLANDRTLADPEIVQVDRGGRVRLRIINGASSSQFWIDLGTLIGMVVAADGHSVHPVRDRRFPIAMAQRLDILLDLPAAGAFPILARLEGSVRQTGIILATAGAHIPQIPDDGEPAPPVDNSLELRLTAVQPLRQRPADITRAITLAGAMKPYAWSMNGEYWPQVMPLMLSAGQRVEIELVNHSMMAHPMHLHGHALQVVAIDGQPVQGAVRDTVLVPPRMGQIRIAFDADNPGRWAFHCHNLYHMQTGMMTEVRYHGIP